MNIVTTKKWAGFKETSLTLESGQTLGPIDLSYETYGTLNKAKDNTVLVCHALTGDAHVSGYHKKGDKSSLGWWDKVIGVNKAIDTKTHFVICINTIGSCKGSTGPASIDQKTGKEYGLNFPVITIGDMVKTQKELLDHLGIPHLKMVIGGSMGGMQALEWVALYPDFVRAAVPIAATAQVSPQAIAFDAVGRYAIVGDNQFQDGDYYQDQSAPHHGLTLARMIGHITYLSERSMDKKFGRKLQQKEDYQFNLKEEFQIESYLKHQGDKFVNHFDANAYLYLTKAVSYFDMKKKYGSLQQAFKASNAKFLLISITSDWLYTPAQSKEVARHLMKMNKEVTYIDIDSHYGHDAFLIDNPDLMTIIKVFLEKV